MGHVIKRDVMCTPVGKYRRLHIYLPTGYANSDERYPVMYFFDGHNLFSDEDATFGKSWGLKEFLDSWDKHMIIVGMECGHEGNERLAEYLPYHLTRAVFGNKITKGDEVFQWIINEVKPMMDWEYRTYGFREATGIAGSSMGGLMAVYGLVHHNNVFSKGACVSSAISFCMPQLMNDMKESDISPDTRAFLSWGNCEAKGVKDVWAIDSSSYTYRRNKAVANKFEERGAAVQLFSQPGGNHCEADWEKQVPHFMDFLWKQ